MKKLLIYSCTLLFVCCTLNSCSSDDAAEYFDEMSIEKRLTEMKQQFHEFGEKYGIVNISFNDLQMRKHLNATKDDIEREVLSMAIAMKKMDKSSSTMRKYVRKRSISLNGEDENHVFVCLKGKFTDTHQRDSLIINYEMELYSGEIGGFYITPSSTTITLLRKCDNPNCTQWHNTGITVDGKIWHIEHDTPIVSYGAGIGSIGNIRCYCSFDIASVDVDYKLTTHISKHVEASGVIEAE